jgi:1-phosphofructokinase family hexose kinase
VILTAGLTPAWQQVMVFDDLRLGQVNRAREAHWCASGKVLNAGIAAHRLGGPSLTLATVGGPPLSEIERDFQALGVPHRWILTHSATRVCTTLLDRRDGTITELVENGRPLAEEELDRFRTAYAEEVARADVAVVIGSLPSGTRDTFYRELLALTPCPAILDFRGAGLLSVLDLRPYAVKPNREELALTVDFPLATDDDVWRAMRSLNERGAQWVIVTQGGGPVWISSASNRRFRLHPPKAREVVNPIGCGDALAATIAWATRNGRPLLEAARLGMAAAAANLRQMFPCRFDTSRIEEEARDVEIETMPEVRSSNS